MLDSSAIEPANSVLSRGASPAASIDDNQPERPGSVGGRQPLRRFPHRLHRDRPEPGLSQRQDRDHAPNVDPAA